MPPTEDMIFDRLTTTRHILPENNAIQLSMFSSAEPHPQGNAPEFWYYSDLHNLFHSDVPAEPNKPSVAQHHTQKSIHTATPPKFSRSDLYSSHVEVIKHKFYLQGTLFKNATDLKLSRYACWCLTKNNPDLIYARTYFLAPVILKNATHNDIKRYSYHFSRIYLHEELKKLEHQIAGILKKCRIDHQCFYNNFTKDLFAGHSIEQLKTSRNIPIIPGDALANYMGKASLQARINILHNIIEHFNSLPKLQQNSRELEQIVKSAIAHERDKICKTHGILPELDLHTSKVSLVESRLKQIEDEFIKQYINQKLK